jgi:hypothetical protein
MDPAVEAIICRDDLSSRQQIEEIAKIYLKRGLSWAAARSAAEHDVINDH